VRDDRITQILQRQITPSRRRVDVSIPFTMAYAWLSRNVSVQYPERDQPVQLQPDFEHLQTTYGAPNRYSLPMTVGRCVCLVPFSVESGRFKPTPNAFGAPVEVTPFGFR